MHEVLNSVTRPIPREQVSTEEAPPPYAEAAETYEMMTRQNTLPNNVEEVDQKLELEEERCATVARKIHCTPEKKGEVQIEYEESMSILHGQGLPVVGL